MKPLSPTPELEAVIRRCVWFEPPAAALLFPYRLVAYVLTYGLPEDVATFRKYVSDGDLKEALANAPPGIFSASKWEYWNLEMGRSPAPPLPVRKFDL